MPVIHTRLLFTTLAKAPEVAVLPLAEDVLEAGLEDETKGEDEVTTTMLLLGKDVELAAGRDELVLEDVEFDPVNGGGTAALVSTRLPTPQGILSPEGCLELAGGVEDPSASSMVKRVVQVLVAVFGEEYW